MLIGVRPWFLRLKLSSLPTVLRLTGLLFLLVPSPGAAREVGFPIHLENSFVRQLIVDEVFTDPGERAHVWQDANQCNDITLAKPRLEGRDGKLHLIADFDAKLGAGIGNWCLNVTDWTGILDAALEPRLHDSLPIVEFRVVDSHMFDSDGEKNFRGTLWDWVKTRIHPRLETIRIDLYRPITELKAFLPVLFPTSDLERTQHVLDSLSLTGVVVEDREITVRVQLDVPEPVPATVSLPAPEPTLSTEELDRWEAAWQSWDAFLTFLVKHSSDDATDDARKELREVFLEARYDIVEILRPTKPRSSDPVRPLFLKTWKRLAPVMRSLTTNLPGEEALRYMSFIAAADALAALEQLGPEYGIEISTDGLRRLARMIEPAPPVDPTAYDEEVDSDLRKLFGFGPPLPTPVIEEEELHIGVEESAEETPTPETEPTVTPEAQNQLQGFRSTDQHKLTQTRPAPRHPSFRLKSIGVHRRSSAVSILRAAAPKLDRWIPARDEITDYLTQVREVLLATQTATQKEKALDARYSILYRNMMLATAWQESCWRQFIKKSGAVVPLTSPVGAVGIMQVNQRVWRGFYDQKSLQQSLAYNAKAGSEILHHYLVDYAIARGEEKARGDMDDLARATYAAYNGGPGKLRRYRRESGGKTGHRIDDAFWKKYRQIKDGNDLAVASCFGVA